MADINLDRLQSNLLTSGLQSKDPPLFQVISQLIKYLRQIQLTTSGGGGSGGGSGSGGAPVGGDYITWANDTVFLPNSRQLLAGDFLAFDDSIVGERTINGVEWSVLTDGDLVAPQLIFALGDVIMTHVP